MQELAAKSITTAPFVQGGCICIQQIGNLLDDNANESRD